MKTQLKLFLILFLITTTIIANAQIKVRDDGQVSLGSLTTTYGVQVNTNGQTSFRSTLNTSGHWVTQVKLTMTECKNWAINNSNYSVKYRFYVNGNGIVYKIGDNTISDPRLQEGEEDIDNAIEVLEDIDGFYYNFVDDTIGGEKNRQRRVGLSAVQVEKAIPEAVNKDENGIMYVDYEVMTVFLLEAVKEQQKEIKNLREMLNKNGL